MTWQTFNKQYGDIRHNVGRVMFSTFHILAVAVDPLIKSNYNQYYPPTLIIHGSVTPARHGAMKPREWAPCGQRDGSDCLCHLHGVEELNQHDVIIQSLVVITIHREISNRLFSTELSKLSLNCAT